MNPTSTEGDLLLRPQAISTHFFAKGALDLGASDGQEVDAQECFAKEFVWIPDRGRDISRWDGMAGQG